MQTEEVEELTIKVQRIEGRQAYLPRRSTKVSAALDIMAPEAGTIPPRSGVIQVPLNIKIKLPRGTYGQILEKSGLAMIGIHVRGGVIDSDYTGNVSAITE